MKSKEVLASVIHHQDKQKAYDRYCKRIFSNKQILASGTMSRFRTTKI
ncbi:hypothetical protein [Amedibacillus dolichus]